MDLKELNPKFIYDPFLQGASGTSPISIQGRGRGSAEDDDSSPPASLSSSFGSSYGSPGSDLAEIRDLKKNFSNQVLTFFVALKGQIA